MHEIKKKIKKRIKSKFDYLLQGLKKSVKLLSIIK